MPLTPEEQKELELLEKQYGGGAQAGTGGLTPEEQAELQALEAQYGQGTPQAEPQGDVLSPLEAGLESFGQVAAMGYLPQAQAGTQKAIDALFGSPTAEADAKLKEQGFSLPEEESYVEARDSYIDRGEKLSEENPLASTVGTGLGIGASMLAPGMAAGKGAGFLSGMGRGAVAGGAQGAAYNPGDEEGEVDPLQLGDRALNAGIGATLGGAIGGATGIAGKLAKRQKMTDQIKDSAGLGDMVKGEVDYTLAGVKQNYISPRRAQVKELISGIDNIDVNPDRIKGVSPGLDRYAKALSKNTPEGQVRANLTGPKADRLKRVLDARASYKNATAYGDPEVLKSGETAKKAADLMRKKIYGKAPEAEKLNAEISDAMRLSDVIGRKAKTAPIAATKGAPGTDKGVLVDKIQKMSGRAGESLEDLSGRIGTAQENLMDPRRLIHLLQAPQEVRRMAVRAVDKVGSVSEAPLRKTTKPTLSLILEKLRDTRSENE